MLNPVPPAPGWYSGSVRVDINWMITTITSVFMSTFPQNNQSIFTVNIDKLLSLDVTEY